MQSLRRLVITEAKSTPTLKPVSVFMSHLVRMPHEELQAMDSALIDFATFRSTRGSSPASAATTMSNRQSEAKAQDGMPSSTEKEHDLYHNAPSFPIFPWPLPSSPLAATTITCSKTTSSSSSSSCTPKRRRIMFCDTSILLQRPLSALDEYVSSITMASDNEDGAIPPSSDSKSVLSIVFPFSALLLARFQAAQTESSVSSAFRVGVYSQLRQLSQLSNTDINKNNNNAAVVKPPPPICVMSPSTEIALLTGRWSCQQQPPRPPPPPPPSHSSWSIVPPERVLDTHCVTGEGAFSAHFMPRLVVQAQRSFGSAPGAYVACVGSAHRNVQGLCLRQGIFCDSLAQFLSSSTTSRGSTGGSDGGLLSRTTSRGGENNHHQRASELCQGVVRKFKALSSDTRRF